ncbi:hypothetical protein NL526_27870, partial [Klebsiella pneumoniae]|nr:hypothetical protein [Klebsiella pneumoniae]
GAHAAPAPARDAAAPVTAPAAAGEPQRRVEDAVQVIEQMKSDTHLREVLQTAKGLFIVPHHGRAGLIVGGEGGEGVLVTRQGAGWSNPVF